MTEPITTFDDMPVYKAAVEVRNLGGGFRDAMKIEPAVMQSDDRVYFICEAIVGDIDHSRIDKENLSAGWTRIHVLSASAVTFVERSLVEETLSKHKARVALYNDEISGQQRTPTDAELDLEHFAGKHADGLVDGCPSCGTEVAAEDQESREAKAAENRAKSEGDGFYDPAKDEAVAEPTPLAGRRKRGAKP